MAIDNSKVRLNIDIDYQLAKKLDKIPWGLKSDVIRMLLDQLAERMEKDGGVKTIYLLLDNKCNPTEELLAGKEF